MTSLGIRPRFRQVVNETPEKVLKKIEDELSRKDTNCIGVVLPSTITLKMPEDQQHFWTPQLNLSLEKNGDSETLIRGFYGPSPSVWSIFTFGYATVGILSAFMLVLATSQWMLKKDPSLSFWILLFLGIVALGLYLTAQFGQKLGAQQMFTLHQFFEKAVGVHTNL